VTFGKYVLHVNDHFQGVYLTSASCTIHDNGTARSVQGVSDMESYGVCTWFRLVKTLSPVDQERVDRNRALALQRRSDRLSCPEAKRTRSSHPSVTAEQLHQIERNREAADARRRTQLIRPVPPASWQSPKIPEAPSDFLTFNVQLPELRWLRTLNEHPRDHRLVFFADSHKYLVSGSPTLGSVTGLIHAFCEPFDPDTAIRLMTSGRDWPRPGYLRDPFKPETLTEIRAQAGSSALMRSLEAQPRDERNICVAARSFAQTSPRAADLVSDLVLNTDEILQKWDHNRDMAAHQGTWMHYLCEAWLNRAVISEDSAEMRLFIPFAKSLSGLTAYRTEWTIFGCDENLAGSIDFVAKDDQGLLHLFDWKRSKDLRSKYSCRWRRMLEPLEHLDDCSGNHYRLQLNCLGLSCLV